MSDDISFTLWSGLGGKWDVTCINLQLYWKHVFEESVWLSHSQTVSLSFFYGGRRREKYLYNIKTLYLHFLALQFIKHFLYPHFSSQTAHLSALCCWCRNGHSEKNDPAFSHTANDHPTPDVQPGPDPSPATTTHQCPVLVCSGCNNKIP